MTGNYLKKTNLEEKLEKKIDNNHESEFSLKNLLEFVNLSEKLKTILRHGKTSTGRSESVADHTWRMCLIIMLINQQLDKKIDTEKALKMAVVHDLVEIFSGDIPYFLVPNGSPQKKEKEINEKAAIDKIKKLIPGDVGDLIKNLWEEYEISETYEAKLVKSIDKIEALIQLNQTPFEDWLDCEIQDTINGRIEKYCIFDRFIFQFYKSILMESNRIISDKKHGSLIEK